MNPSDLQNPALWKDSDDVTPPAPWEFIAADDRWWWPDPGDYPSSPFGDLTFLGGDPILSADAECHWEVTEAAGFPASLFGFDISFGGVVLESPPSNATGSGSFTVPAGTDVSTMRVSSPLGSGYHGVIALNFTGTDPPAGYCVDLTWTESMSALPITGYDVYRSIEGAAFTLIASLSAAARTYHDEVPADLGDDVEYYVIAKTASAQTPSNTVAVIAGPPVGPLFEVLDIPLLDEADAPFLPLVYLAAAGIAAGWPGADVEISRDGGATWDLLASIPAASIIGELTTTLPDHTDAIPDETNEPRVKLLSYGAALADTDADGLAALVNSSIVGDEELQFRDVDQFDADEWDLAYLLRGIEGTAHASHAIGARFVFLDPSKLVRVTLEPSDIGEEIMIRARTKGKTAHTVRTLTFAAVAGDGTS